MQLNTGIEQIVIFHEHSSCLEVDASENLSKSGRRTTSSRKQDSDSSYHPPDVGLRFSAFLLQKLDPILDEVRNHCI